MIENLLKLLKFDVIIENLKAYIETKIELLKLEAQEKLAQILTVILLLMCISFLGMLSFIFLNLALGGFINELLNSQYLGFLIVGGFYFLLMLLLSFNISKGRIHKFIKRRTAALFASRNSKRT